MIRPICNLNINALFRSRTVKKMAKLADTLPTSTQVIQKKIDKINPTTFEEIRFFKNGTTVSRTYKTDKEFKGLQLLRKIVNPAKNKGKSSYEGGIEFETIYTKGNKFWATLKNDCLNCDFTTYFKDQKTGKMVSAEGLGTFNKKFDAVR